MRSRRLSRLLGLLLLVPSVPVQGQDAPFTVTVVATTDVHGRAMHWDYVADDVAPWGLTRVATLVDSLRRAHDGRVVVVDAGDFLQGNPFASYFATVSPMPVHPVIDAFNGVGYDVVVPGNHDFDFGLGTLDSALTWVQFNVSAANVIDVPTGRPRFPEFITLTRGPVRIGVMGLTTPGAMVWNRDRLDGRVRVTPIPETAADVLERMDGSGFDLTIAVVHSGLAESSTYQYTGIGAENAGVRLAAIPWKPDLVVLGHTHEEFADSVVNGVHFMQPAAQAAGVAVATITLRPGPQGYAVDRIVSRTIPLSATAPEPTLADRIRPPHERVRTWLATTVATAGPGWTAERARVEDTPIVDFINRVQRQRSGAQLSAASAFDLGGGFPPGEIRLRHALGLYPYENTLKVVEIDGATLRAYLEKSSEYFLRYEPGRPLINPSVPAFNYDMLSGVRYELDLRQPVGSRVRGLTVDGAPVSADDRFTLALNSYRQSGGGGYSMLQDLPVTYDRGESIRDLLVDEIRRVGVLDTAAWFDRSWRIVPVEAAFAAGDELRGRFGGGDRVLVRILATTDLYGALGPRRTSWSGDRLVGGVVALKAWMDSLQAECDCLDLRLDGGNHLRGSLAADESYGGAIVAAFNQVGYDAVTLGRNDLGLGADTLDRLRSAAEYDVLGASPDPGWRGFERDGIRTAVIGVSSGFAPTELPDTAVVEWMAESVQRAVRGARDAGADFVVVVAHADAVCDASGCGGALFDFVMALPPRAVDLVVGGHSDAEAVQYPNGIPVVLPGSRGLTFGVADLVVRTDGRREIRARIETAYADVGNADARLSAMVDSLSQRANQVVARNRFPLLQPRGEQNAYARLMADALRNVGRTQVALAMLDAVEADLSDGDLTLGAIYRSVPGRRRLYRADLDRDGLESVLEAALADSGGPSASLSGIEVEYDPGRPPGRRVRRISWPGGERVEDDQFSVTLSDGPLLDLLRASGTTAQSLDATDFNAIVRYLQRLRSPVEGPRDERWIRR